MCPAFPYPLLSLSSDSDPRDGSEAQQDFAEWSDHPAIMGAKKHWKRLYEAIMDVRTDIPLKQMALKAKHQHVIFN